MCRHYGKEANNTILPFIEIMLLGITIISLANNECRTFWHWEFYLVGCHNYLEEVSSNCILLSTHSYMMIDMKIVESGLSFDVIMSHYIFHLLAETAAIASAVFKKEYALVEKTPLSFEWQPIDLREQLFSAVFKLFLLWAFWLVREFVSHMIWDF